MNSCVVQLGTPAKALKVTSKVWKHSSMLYGTAGGIGRIALTPTLHPAPRLGLERQKQLQFREELVTIGSLHIIV
jgi:hypothetical protein